MRLRRRFAGEAGGLGAYESHIFYVADFVEACGAVREALDLVF